ncbi:unnamed protein product, partial [Vitis vinifera]
MTKVYGTGAYDFKRHRVAEYPVESANQVAEPKTGSAIPNTITLLEIQRDRLTKIAEAKWSKAGEDSKPKKPFDPKLVKEIYETELVVSGGRKTVPLQRVMILEVSQYLENYLWPNFDPETASFEHVMSMILMVNEKFRENVAAWICFYDRKDVFKAFIEKVLRLKEQGRSLSIAEKTNYLLFMINAFQSLEDEIVSETVLRLASLQSWLSLSYGRFQMELCLNTDLIKKWKRMIKREAKEAMKQGDPFDPSTMLEAKFLRNIIEEFLEVLDSKVFSHSHGDDEDNELVDAIGFEKVNDACILYCERFMEFLIDLLSQLPTRRYLRPIVSDVAVVAKCHLSALYTHEKGKLFAQLVDLLQFYEGFEINDHVGTQLNDDEVLQSHYDRLQSFQLLAFKKIPKLRELALANIGGIHRRADLSKRLSVLSPEELKDLVCCKLKLVSMKDPWSERVDFLIEVMVSFFEKQQSQKEAINALPLYPNEQIMWDESLVPSINYSGEGCLALPKLNLQFLTLHDYLLRNFNLFRLESTYEIREDIQEAPSSVTAAVTFSISKEAAKANLMNETCIVPDWLHNIFLGYGNPSAAQWTNMPDLLETVDFKDTFLDADHLRESFSDYQVQFINPDGTENLHPRPPFRIRLPRTLKGNIHALPGNKKSSTASMNDVSMADAGSEQEKLIVEAYIPPDPGPYPQDQPKQNSVRFTPTQIVAINSGIQPGLTMVVGPPGTGKTDTAVQILNVLYHNCPSQRTLIITHSNQALNDLFEKIMQRDVPARYLLRLGQGEQELATDLDFSRQGRVNAMLVRRLELLSEVERLARSLQLPEDVGYTCETAGYFWLLHVYSHWEQFLAACSGNEDKPTFVQDHMRAAKGCFRHLKTMFQELEECRAFELLKSTADRANYLMTKQAKIVAMTCTHAALKRKDFLQLGFKYDNLLMEESIPYIELNAQGRARPSIAQLYNWRYRELGDLPYVKEAGYPASKISILTTYNGQKLLIRDVINRRCIPYDFIGPPSKVTTVDKFQGQQNDFILLSLVRTRFVGHLRDVRRLVVAMSRARLGLYVFCRRSLFEQCYELQPTFQLLLQRPDHLALNLNETTSFTDRHVADPGLVQLVSGVEEMSGIVNFKMHQVYQARVMGHQFDQFSAHSGQVAPSLGGWEEQNSQLNSTSQHQPMDADRPADSHDANGDLPPESKSGEATEMEVLENRRDGASSPENNLKEKTDMNGDRGGAPVESSSHDENRME